MSTSPDAKVLFRVVDEDGSVNVETLWATSVGPDRYQLDNSPFYAYSVSWKDIVFAPHNAEEECATFQRVETKSGHRTVRVIFDPPVQDGNPSDVVLRGLVALGCTYEGSHRRLFSVNIPPETQLDDVRHYLIDHEAQWEHADPSYDELYPDEA